MRLSMLTARRRHFRGDHVGHRGRRLRLESLETRRMLSVYPPIPVDGELVAKCELVNDGVEFEFTIEPALAKSYPLLQANMERAGEILSELVAGQGCIDVLVKAGDPSRFTDEIVAWTMGPESSYPVTSTVWEPGTLHEARTGYDPNDGAPDVIIEFSTAFLATDAWFDASGSPGGANIPPNQTDVVSVALHELLHGLGFSGSRTTTPNDNWGKFLQSTKSTYDSLTAFGTGGGFADTLGGLDGSNKDTLFFNGSHAMDIYGGPVPLHSAPKGMANFYHVGNTMGEGKFLASDLMSGMILVTGARTLPSELDLAILYDLGWQPTTWSPVAPLMQLPWLEVMPPTLRPPIPEVELGLADFYVSPPSFGGCDAYGVFDTYGARGTNVACDVGGYGEYVNWAAYSDAALGDWAGGAARTGYLSDWSGFSLRAEKPLVPLLEDICRVATLARSGSTR